NLLTGSMCWSWRIRKRSALYYSTLFAECVSHHHIRAQNQECETSPTQCLADRLSNTCRTEHNSTLYRSARTRKSRPLTLARAAKPIPSLTQSVSRDGRYRAGGPASKPQN